VKFDSRDLALMAVFAALYFVINVAQTLLFSGLTVFGPIQLRVSDCLIPLAALFGLPVVGGVTLGCFLTNGYFFLGPPDVIIGPIANLLAAFLIVMLRKHRLVACLVGSLPVGLMVGSYLWIYFPPTATLSFLPVWVAMIISITLSSIIAIGILGYLLLSGLSRRGIIEPLKSHGLKVVENKKLST